MTQRARFVALTFLVAVALVTSLAWAQGPGAPAPATPAPAPSAPPGAPPAAGSFTGLLVITVVAIGIIAILAAVAKLYDRRRTREADAVALQSRLSDLLLTERGLHGGTVTPTVVAPMWGRPRMTVEVSGEVPSPDARDMIIRKVRQEAQAAGRDVEVEDKLMVLPPVQTGRAA